MTSLATYLKIEGSIMQVYAQSLWTGMNNDPNLL